METIFDLDNHLWDPYLRDCPARGLLELLANKWTALVVGALSERPHRFGELRRRVEGISQKVLTQNLRNLERDGLISRTVYATTPPSVEYALTDLGESVADHLVALSMWSLVNFRRVYESRVAYDRRAEEAPAVVA